MTPALPPPDPRFGWTPGQPPGQPPGRVEPLPLPPVPSVTPEFSRWRGGATSFGPVGRILCTVLLLGVDAAMLLGFSVGFLATAAWLVVTPPILASIWKRARIR